MKELPCATCCSTTCPGKTMEAELAALKQWGREVVTEMRFPNGYGVLECPFCHRWGAAKEDILHKDDCLFIQGRKLGLLEENK
jgi:hypothetical protein